MVRNTISLQMSHLYVFPGNIPVPGLCPLLNSFPVKLLDTNFCSDTWFFFKIFLPFHQLLFVVVVVVGCFFGCEKKICC